MPKNQNENNSTNLVLQTLGFGQTAEEKFEAVFILTEKQFYINIVILAGIIGVTSGILILVTYGLYDHFRFKHYKKLNPNNNWYDFVTETNPKLYNRKYKALEQAGIEISGGADNTENESESDSSESNPNSQLAEYENLQTSWQEFFEDILSHYKFGELLKTVCFREAGFYLIKPAYRGVIRQMIRFRVFDSVQLSNNNIIRVISRDFFIMGLMDSIKFMGLRFRDQTELHVIFNFATVFFTALPIFISATVALGVPLANFLFGFQFSSLTILGVATKSFYTAMGSFCLYLVNQLTGLKCSRYIDKFLPQNANQPVILHELITGDNDVIDVVYSSGDSEFSEIQTVPLHEEIRPKVQIKSMAESSNIDSPFYKRIYNRFKKPESITLHELEPNVFSEPNSNLDSIQPTYVKFKDRVRSRFNSFSNLLQKSRVDNDLEFGDALLLSTAEDITIPTSQPVAEKVKIALDEGFIE